MSRVHLYLEKKAEDGRNVVYAAMCGDFSSEIQSVAKLKIDKVQRQYEFERLGPWLEEEVLPPQFFALPQEEQPERYRREYVDFKYGAWTARIHAWVTALIESGTYPDRAPLPRTE